MSENPRTRELKVHKTVICDKLEGGLYFIDGRVAGTTLSAAELVFAALEIPWPPTPAELKPPRKKPGRKPKAILAKEEV